MQTLTTKSNYLSTWQNKRTKIALSIKFQYFLDKFISFTN